MGIWGQFDSGVYRNLGISDILKSHDELDDRDWDASN